MAAATTTSTPPTTISPALLPVFCVPLVVDMVWLLPSAARGNLPVMTGRFPLAADGRSHTMSTTNGTQNTGNRAGLIVVGGVLVVVAAATALVLLL